MAEVRFPVLGAKCRPIWLRLGKADRGSESLSSMTPLE